MYICHTHTLGCPTYISFYHIQPQLTQYHPPTPLQGLEGLTGGGSDFPPDALDAAEAWIDQFCSLERIAVLSHSLHARLPPLATNSLLRVLCGLDPACDRGALLPPTDLPVVLPLLRSQRAGGEAQPLEQTWTWTLPPLHRLHVHWIGDRVRVASAVMSDL